MSETESATLRIGDTNHEFPVVVGTENEYGIDIGQLRAQTKWITFDPAYGNTGSCKSDITYIDGEKGILRYRGYPIEELAKHSNFIETAYLLIYGELPKEAELKSFSKKVGNNALLHESMVENFKNFPSRSHPMAILSAMLNALGCYHPEMTTNQRQEDLDHFDEAAAFLISKVRTIAAHTYRMKKGLPISYSNPELGYTQNFLHMMFSEPHKAYIADESVFKSLILILILHADHEQNCSTSTVRMVASSGANLFASVSAGVSALWGPLHGGANMAVIEMLEQIKTHDEGNCSRFMEEVKKKERKLMGFGHRVYKNYDPRAKILKDAADDVLKSLGVNDPLLDLAKKLEEIALSDSYFVERKLYPNVDFYSGIILRAIGIPLEMFTVMFAMGRLPGWISHWKEVAEDTKSRISRPRQIYTGHTERSYVAMSKR